MGPVGQPFQATGLVAADPAVDTLAADAVAFGDSTMGTASSTSRTA